MTSQYAKAQSWQFSLATVLLVMTTVAVAVGWWTDRRRLGQHVEVLEATIEDEKRALEVERSKLEMSRKMQMLHAQSIQAYIRENQTLRATVEELRQMHELQLPGGHVDEGANEGFLENRSNPLSRTR